MKLKFYLIFSTLIAILFVSACSNSSDDEGVRMPDIKIGESKSGNDLVFNDFEIEQKSRAVRTFNLEKEESIQTMHDGSRIVSMRDGYGNIINTRYFFSHPNLYLLTLKIFANGQKEGIIFGHNGEHKTIPSDLLEQALTAPGNDIASKVGIFSTKIETSKQLTIVPNNQSDQIYPATPDPSMSPVEIQPQTPEIKNETTTPLKPQTVKTDQNPVLPQENPNKDTGNKNLIGF
jgi:hypothetical protein